MPTYEQLHDAAGWIPLETRTRISIAGTDRATVLNNLCTNRVLALEPGHGCEAFILDVKGRTLAHVLVLADSDALLLETDGGQADTLINHLDRYIIREDAELRDLSADTEWRLVAGHEADRRLTTRGLTPPKLPLEHRRDALDGEPLHLIRLPWTAPPGWLLATNRGRAGDLPAHLAAAEIEELPAAAWEPLRIEAGWPAAGREITPQRLAQEIDRNEQTLDLNKGCYLGQETVARLDALGHVNRQLVGLRFAGPTESSAKLFAQGRDVGQVTSAAESPRWGWIGLGLVRVEHCVPGTQLETDAGVSVEVAKLP